MKLIQNLLSLKSILKLIVVFLVVSQIKSEILEKVLFAYKYKNLEHDPKHVLHTMNYKNVVFSPQEMTIYESKNPNEPVSILFKIK
jgi:hypothetical protein